jgi:radical SAM protein with 4Fe4S-binding SPASM domain
MGRDPSFEVRPELSTGGWIEVLDLLSVHGVQNICFTGGEALLREDLWDIISYGASLRVNRIVEKDGVLLEKVASPKLYLLSNGKRVDDDVLDLCRRYDVQLSVSLPGLKHFRELTGGGDPDQVLRVFEGARKRGLTTVVGITVTKKNLPELYETIAAAFLSGASQLLLNRFLEGGRGRAYARDLALTRDELIQMLDVAEAALNDARRFGSVGTELPLCLFDPRKYQRLDVSTGCSAARGFFVIGPSGHVRVCNHSPIELRHYGEIDLLKTDPYWRKFTQSDYLPSACWQCRDVGRCAGGCREAAHIISGSVDACDVLVAHGEGK